MINGYRIFVKALIFTFLISLTNCLYAANNNTQKLYDAAMSSYVYLYPLVLMDISKKVMTNVSSASLSRKAPINQFSHAAEFPSPQYHDFVRPNADTLYSFGWLDLSKEPMILSVPDTNGRYYLMPMLDAWTEIIASPGKRTTGTLAGDFLIVGPNWNGEIPKNLQTIQATTNIIWIMGRTLTNGKEDYDNVHQLQKNFKLTPLSQWGKDYIPPTGLPIDPDMDMSQPSSQVVNMDAEHFFTAAANILKSNPPHQEDTEILKQLEIIGIIPGQSFDISKFTQDEIKELNRAANNALRAIKLYYSKTTENINGWAISKETGLYGTNYLNRASIAYGGIGANLPEDAIYPIAFRDVQGKILRGVNKYILHFPANQLPPVKGFWSVTLYGHGGYFEPNSIDRYAIGDRDPLKFNNDGSLDIYIQNESPGKNNESNWLPAPKKNFNLAMRLYWPDVEILEGDWLLPTVQKY